MSRYTEGIANFLISISKAESLGGETGSPQMKSNRTATVCATAPLSKMNPTVDLPSAPQDLRRPTSQQQFATSSTEPALHFFTPH